MSSIISMKRAHDEKISFWPASGSVVVVVSPGNVCQAGVGKAKSLTIWVCVFRFSSFVLTLVVTQRTRRIFKASNSIHTEKLESSGTYDGSHCDGRLTTLAQVGREV